MAGRSTSAAFTFLLLAGCASPFAAGRAEKNTPQTFALLLNGGGTPNVNYFSHVQHLTGMIEVLRARGLGTAAISVLSSDGPETTPDLAIGIPAEGPHAWLVDGTFLERPVGRPIRRVSVRLKEVEAQAARRADVDQWFGNAAQGLRAKDTLFFFVSEHGEKGVNPQDARIALWDREAISVKELGLLLGKLPPDVRVVTVMSQCYSGAFAEMALAPVGGRKVGSTCGYFSTNATRMAYGCYPESVTVPEDGYAFRMIQGLRRSPSLAAAHDETLLTDRTPDVPLRSSDIYIERFVAGAAAKHKVSPDELVASLASTVLAQKGDSEEARVIREIAASFAIPVPSDPRDLPTTTQRLEEMRERLTDSDGIWSAALGELAQANLDEFLAAKPAWQDKVSPRALERIPLKELPAAQSSFVTELAAFTSQRPSRLALLQHGRARQKATRAAAFRSATRAAALLRLRALVTTLVGRQLLEQEGTPEERADFAALRACEDFTLPRAGQQGNVASAPRPFPSVENDERLATSIAPASLGAALAEPPASERSARQLPAGAVTVVAVDPDSPAKAVGLRAGDIVLGGDGQPVQDRGAMKLFLASSTTHERQLNVLRGQQRLTVPVKLRIGTRAQEARDLRAAGRSALASLTPFRGPLDTTLGARKPYLLFFWATWCTFCKQAIPELMALERERGISIVSITDETPGIVNMFLGSWPQPFPNLIALDRERRVNEGFQIDGYPTFVLVDENGRTPMRSAGYRAGGSLPIEGWVFGARAGAGAGR